MMAGRSIPEAQSAAHPFAGLAASDIIRVRRRGIVPPAGTSEGAARHRGDERYGQAGQPGRRVMASVDAKTSRPVGSATNAPARDGLAPPRLYWAMAVIACGICLSVLDSTLVMVSSEFGRTPKINATAGRDHWPKVFSVVLAGGGIKKGSVYGTSDATATEPEDDPLSVEDLSTTVYHCLGITAEKELMSPGNRPIEIVDGGKLVKALLA